MPASPAAAAPSSASACPVTRPTHPPPPPPPPPPASPSPSLIPPRCQPLQQPPGHAAQSRHNHHAFPDTIHLNANGSPQLPSFRNILAIGSSHSQQQHSAIPQQFRCPYSTICAAMFSAPEDLQLHLIEEHPLQPTCRPKMTSIPSLYPDSVPSQRSETFSERAQFASHHVLTGQPLFTEPNSDASTASDPFTISQINFIPTYDSKKYNCTECSKTFASRAGLKSHILTHTGERPYACRECGKSYTTNNRLKVHSRIHTGELPYMCDFPGCEFRAKQKCSLTPHALKHLSEDARRTVLLEKKRTIACPFCGRLYKSNKSLDQHCGKEHKNDMRRVEPALSGSGSGVDRLLSTE
ncbi:hypothetical protein BC830DRAFT_679706 [Chytriomyces sp. MP71]|nr:hypothetical protein BC830DRAFT_679706 [Chytriomyces sp. MP71]